MAFSLMLIKQRSAAHQQAAKHSNIRSRFHPVAERRSILRTASHEPAEQHANNRVEFCKEFFTHVFDTEEAAQQRSHTLRGVCTKLPVSTLHLHMPSILRSGSREPRANSRVEFCEEFFTHVFVTEEAPKQRSQTIRGDCTKLPVCKLRMPSILRSGSRELQTKYRVEFRREFLKHVFVKGLPAKQRSKTFRFRVCPHAPPRKKRTANMLEHHRSELESCNLATRFEELQVEEEVHMEETHRVEEVVEFAPRRKEWTRCNLMTLDMCQLTQLYFEVGGPLCSVRRQH